MARPWRGTPGSYLLSHALLALKVVVFAHCSAIHRDVNCVGFDPSGKKLVSGSSDKTVRVWDATTGEPIGSPLDVDGSILSLDFSPCGTKIAAACNDWDKDNYTVKILGSSSESAGTFECKSTLTGHRYVPSL